MAKTEPPYFESEPPMKEMTPRMKEVLAALDGTFRTATDIAHRIQKDTGSYVGTPLNRLHKMGLTVRAEYVSGMITYDRGKKTKPKLTYLWRLKDSQESLSDDERRARYREEARKYKLKILDRIEQLGIRVVFTNPTTIKVIRHKNTLDNIGVSPTWLLLEHVDPDMKVERPTS
jgi:hypothetical protein